MEGINTVALARSAVKKRVSGPRAPPPRASSSEKNFFRSRKAAFDSDPEARRLLEIFRVALVGLPRPPAPKRVASSRELGNSARKIQRWFRRWRAERRKEAGLVLKAHGLQKAVALKVLRPRFTKLKRKYYRRLVMKKALRKIVKALWKRMIRKRRNSEEFVKAFGRFRELRDGKGPRELLERYRKEAIFALLKVDFELEEERKAEGRTEEHSPTSQPTNSSMNQTPDPSANKPLYSSTLQPLSQSAFQPLTSSTVQPSQSLNASTPQPLTPQVLTPQSLTPQVITFQVLHPQPLTPSVLEPKATSDSETKDHKPKLEEKVFPRENTEKNQRDSTNSRHPAQKCATIEEEEEEKASSNSSEPSESIVSVGHRPIDSVRDFPKLGSFESESGSKGHWPGPAEPFKSSAEKIRPRVLARLEPPEGRQFDTRELICSIFQPPRGGPSTPSADSAHRTLNLSRSGTLDVSADFKGDLMLIKRKLRDKNAPSSRQDLAAPPNRPSASRPTRQQISATPAERRGPRAVKPRVSCWNRPAPAPPRPRLSAPPRPPKTPPLPSVSEITAVFTSKFKPKLIEVEAIPDRLGYGGLARFALSRVEVRGMNENYIDAELRTKNIVARLDEIYTSCLDD